MTVEKAIEAIYTSLQANNENLDTRIAELKTALTAAGKKEAIFNPKLLPQGNRQGRKLMQSYFKKRGVAVEFEAEAK